MSSKSPILLIFFLVSLLLYGCGKNEAPSITPTASPEPIVTVTPTPEPTVTVTPTPEPTATATPIPVLSPLEKKYQYYDSTYNGNGMYASTGDAETLEALLSDSLYYNTWLGYGDQNYNDSMVIDESTRNGKEYAVKCLVLLDDGGISVYYYYTDNPNEIYLDQSYPLDTGLGVFDALCDNEGNPYSTLSADQVEAFYFTETEELNNYTPLSIGDMYIYAIEKAKKVITADLGSAADHVFAGFYYDNESDVYFQYDGDCTYYIGFNIKYHWATHNYPYYMECIYVDENKDHKIKLRNYDLSRQY